MAMKAQLENVQVLELYEGEFDGDEGKIPFFQLRCYSYGENFPGIKVLKVKKDFVADARKLVGSTCNILVDVYTGKKTTLVFCGLAAAA